MPPFRRTSDQWLRWAWAVAWFMTTEAKLDSVVTDVVRRMSRETTPEEMQARGVRKVRSVSLSRVAGLIENAIQTALMQRHLGVVEDHQKAFSEAARQEFVRLIEGGSPQAAPPEAEDALDRLKSQLRSRRETLEEDQRSWQTGQGHDSESDQALEGELRQVFVHWGGDSGRLSPLEQEITQVAVRALRQERTRGAQADLARRAKEIDVLERRVAKLSGELHHTEAELARVLAAKNIDPGLQSIYSEVQGLSTQDDEYERKSELMTALFAANIELRARIDSETVEQAPAAPVPSSEPLVDPSRRDALSTARQAATVSANPAQAVADGRGGQDRDWAQLWTRGRTSTLETLVPQGRPTPAHATEAAQVSPVSPLRIPAEEAPAHQPEAVAEPVAPSEAPEPKEPYVSAPSWLLIT